MGSTTSYPSTGPTPTLGLAAITAITLAAAVFPATHTIVRTVREASRDRAAMLQAARVDPSLVLSTLAYAAAVAALAVALALPLALAIRRRGLPLAPLVLVPALLPSYLTYAAWNLLRAPRTPLGDAIERAAMSGFEDLPLIVGRALAVLGLAVWASPVAALVAGGAMRHVERDVEDALESDGAGSLRRAVAIAWIARRGLARAFAVVLLLMLGSAVPFHVAQVPTLAIDAWTAVTQAPGSTRGFVAAWPALLAAVVASIVLTRRAFPPTLDAPTTPPRAGSVLMLLPALGVWSLGSLVPLALFAIHLATHRGEDAFRSFLRAASPGIVASLRVALAVGAAGAILSVGAYLAASSTRAHRRFVRVLLAVLLAAGLAPGILVGVALFHACDALPFTRPLVATPALLVLGHLARFAFLPVLIGLALAHAEPRDLAELRTLDAPRSLADWWRAALAPHAWAFAASGVLVALLSLYEIESSIVLVPPGPASLPQTLLNYLHYARVDELCAGSTILVSAGLALALAVAWIAGHALQTSSNPETRKASSQ